MVTQANIHEVLAGWARYVQKLHAFFGTYGVTSQFFGNNTAAPMGSAVHRVQSSGLNYAYGT